MSDRGSCQEHRGINCWRVALRLRNGGSQIPDRWLSVGRNTHPEFHLSMDCFWCNVVSDELTLKEYEAAKRMTAEAMKR